MVIKKSIILVVLSFVINLNAINKLFQKSFFKQFIVHEHNAGPFLFQSQFFDFAEAPAGPCFFLHENFVSYSDDKSFDTVTFYVAKDTENKYYFVKQTFKDGNVTLQKDVALQEIKKHMHNPAVMTFLNSYKALALLTH